MGRKCSSPFQGKKYPIIREIAHVKYERDCFLGHLKNDDI
jgi:hypothetical protein